MEWLTIGLSVLGGGFAVKLLEWMTFREDKLWARIGACEARIAKLEQELDKTRQERDQLKGENLLLKSEINDLCEEQGQPPRYDLKA